MSFLSRSLTYKSCFSLVYRYQPKRSIFDQTSYIDGYVPRPNKYHKTRKPRLSQWDDPKVIWPVLLPPPTKNTGNNLIKELEDIEKLKIESNRDFMIPDFRSGDVIQFTYYHSLSEKKSNTYTGICIGRRKRNELQATFRVLFRFCGVLVEMDVKQNSPFLANIKIIHRGSGNLRNRLTHLSQMELTKEQLMKPIIKGKTMKKRQEDERVALKKVNLSKKIRNEPIDDPLWT